MYQAFLRIVRSRTAGRSAFAYALTACVLWPIPLLNALHAESCAVLALVGFFVAGLASIRHLRDGHDPGPVLLGQVALLVLPLLLLTVAVIWAPNCSYATGLMFFVLFPVVSVVLAVSLAFLLVSLELRRASLAFVCIAAVVVVVSPLFDIGFFPQLYTYNHVFGGVLGPIYDEILAIRPGLFAFRGLSLLWATVLFLAGRIARDRASRRDRVAKVAMAASLMLVIAYSQSARLGWNTTDEVIRNALGSSTATRHFEIYYDDRSMHGDEIDRIADEMEYRYVVLARTLDTSIEDRIRVYLYPTEEVKGRLTGSRSTSVAPVWLQHPQVHMLAGRVRSSFDHELVHVFSREFGMPVIRASPSVGLVEGLAAALEAPDTRPSTAELMAAIIQEGSRDSTSIVDDLNSALGAFGFWTGRGAVSYAATGSFVQFLLEEYGVVALKEAYRTGDFEDAYGKSEETLAAEWYSEVRQSEPVSAAALPMARTQFSIPSLFEMDCPHALPPHVQEYRRGLDFLRVHDTLSAEASFERAQALDKDFLPSRVRLASIRLRAGDYEPVIRWLASDTVAMKYPQAEMLVAEAYAMAGREEDALRVLDDVADLVPDYAIEFRLALWLIRRVAVDSTAARWYFAGSNDAPPPPAITADPLSPLYRASRAIRRQDDREACGAILDWPEEDFALLDADSRPVFAAQTLLWKAESCGRHRPAEAAGAADRAAGMLANAGLPDLARYAAGRADFARWKLSQTDGRTSPTSGIPSSEHLDP